MPSWVSATGVEIEVAGRRVAVDVSYGGAFYATCDAAEFGLGVGIANLESLIRIGREIKWTVDTHPSVSHPEDGRLSGCYGTIWYESIGPLHQRNVTIFADGEVDRSPCGSGTSARLAILHHQGAIAIGDTLTHESIIGTVFTGSVVDSYEESGSTQVLTEIGGYAYRTGNHRFVLDPEDPIGLGFQLR